MPQLLQVLKAFGPGVKQFMSENIGTPQENVTADLSASSRNRSISHLSSCDNRKPYQPEA